MRIRTLLILAATLGLAAAGLAQQPAGPPKIQTLILTGQNGHDWRSTTPLLRQYLESTGKFEVRVMEEVRGAGPETFAPYDLIVLNYFERRLPEMWWGERTQKAFLDFVRAGKGVVVFHFSVAAFDGWTDYEKLCAGNWRPNNGHHSPRHDFTVDVRDTEHPITRGMKTSFPIRSDELYANLRWQPKETYHVLATAWDDHALYQGKARQPIPGAGLDQPMLWVVPFGQGRVFVTALGHDAEAMQSPGFIATYQRGAEWAAKGAVTIPLPQELAQ